MESLQWNTTWKRKRTKYYCIQQYGWITREAGANLWHIHSLYQVTLWGKEGKVTQSNIFTNMLIILPHNKQANVICYKKTTYLLRSLTGCPWLRIIVNKFRFYGSMSHVFLSHKLVVLVCSGCQTKYHGLNGWTNEFVACNSRVWKVPESRVHQHRFHSGTLHLACRWLPFHCLLTWPVPGHV